MKSLKLNKVILYLMTLLVIATTTLATPVAVYAADPAPAEDTSDNNNTGGGGSGSLNDLATAAETAIGDVEDTIVRIAMSLVPLAIVIALFGMLVTHDPKKIKALVSICGTVVVVCALIMIVNGGTVVTIIEEFVNTLGLK